MTGVSIMKGKSLLVALGLMVTGFVSQPSAALDCAEVDLAVAQEARPAADRARDEDRKPSDVLCFFGLKPEMRVFDFFSGGGYYSEILSYVVGPKGEVTAHNNGAYLNFAKDEIAERYKDARLANVAQLTAEADDLEIDEASFDAVLMILAFHDIYYVSEDGSWPTIDGPRLLAELYQGLKPGGVLGVVDHVAAAGSPEDVGTSLHRIDPALMRRQLEAAGFQFEGESDGLRNANDDLTQPMWAEGVRGQTDRVIYRFRKPAAE